MDKDAFQRELGARSFSGDMAVTRRTTTAERRSGNCRRVSSTSMRGSRSVLWVPVSIQLKPRWGLGYGGLSTEGALREPGLCYLAASRYATHLLFSHFALPGDSSSHYSPDIARCNQLRAYAHSLSMVRSGVSVSSAISFSFNPAKNLSLTNLAADSSSFSSCSSASCKLNRSSAETVHSTAISLGNSIC